MFSLQKCSSCKSDPQAFILFALFCLIYILQFLAVTYCPFSFDDDNSVFFFIIVVGDVQVLSQICP